MNSIVAFSPVRWDVFHQRPQQLMSLIARRWRVIFVEEPVTGAAGTWLEEFEPVPGLQVWRPHVTGDAPGFHDDHVHALQPVLADAMDESHITDFWLWLFTPMAFPLIEPLAPRGVVYDCMDDLVA